MAFGLPRAGGLSGRILLALMLDDESVFPHLFISISTYIIYHISSVWNIIEYSNSNTNLLYGIGICFDCFARRLDGWLLCVAISYGV